MRRSGCPSGPPQAYPPNLASARTSPGPRRMDRTGCRRSTSPTRTSSRSRNEPTQQTLLPRQGVTVRSTARRVRLRRTGRLGLLAALLHVRADEFLGVLLENLVDLIEDGVYVVGELFVPFLGGLSRPSLDLFGLVCPLGGLPLPAGVLAGCHVSTSVCPNAIVTRTSPAQSRRGEIGTNSRSPG